MYFLFVVEEAENLTPYFALNERFLRPVIPAVPALETTTLARKIGVHIISGKRCAARGAGSTKSCRWQ